MHCASWTQCTFADSLSERLDPRRVLRRKGESPSETGICGCGHFVSGGEVSQVQSVQEILKVDQNTL